jgi:tetratricopeptide (TPR) repeat protein
VADEGLKIDPYNADLYDLKSNACLFLSDFKCAVDALETMYATDSTKADTLFFTKISAAAAEGEKPDTVRLMKWSQKGGQKYPDNPTIGGYLLRAYAMTCQTDSVVSVTTRVIQKDTTAVPAALNAAKALISPDSTCAKKVVTGPSADSTQKPRTGPDSATTSAASIKRPKEAMPFLDFAIAHGDPQAKENAAALLYQGGASLLQQPQDLAGAAELLRKAVTTANPSGKVAPASNYLLGLATLFQVPQIDPQAEKGKSCDLAKQEEALLTESETALTAGQSVNPDAVKKNLDIIKKYKPRIASMLKAYCK